MEFEKAKSSVLKMLLEKLTNDFYYHNIDHTFDVYQAAIELARMEGVSGEDLTLLKTAALFHDTGYTAVYFEHEAASVEIARKMLPDFSYDSEQIDKIAEMIYSTKIPQSPKSHLSQILCDADLDYLGRSDYYPLSEKLKIELVSRNVIKDENWLQIQIDFLKAHQFFTDSAIALRDSEKKARLAELTKTI